MQRQMLKSKIHRATVTDCDVDYIGSITIDTELMAERRPDHQRAGPRLGHRQRRPLRHLRDRRRARLGHDAGQRRRRPPGPSPATRSSSPPSAPTTRATSSATRRSSSTSTTTTSPSPSTATPRCCSHELRRPLPHRAPASDRQPVTLPRLAEMKAERRTDRDGHRLRLPLGDRSPRRPASTSSWSATPRRWSCSATPAPSRSRWTR